MSTRASSAPSSSPEEERAAALPADSRRTPLPPVNKQLIPDELLLGLTSVCSRSHGAHHRHCKGCGIRRPDAVWHHALGRKKYQYFLEQPTSLTGAGRDISFLCDAVATQKKTTPLPPLADRSLGDAQNWSVSDSLVPEEFHVVKNRGLQSLEFYEDAFTVQLQDDDQKLRVFPSLRPSGRLEVIQLMRMMDDMLLKAGVDQRSEELTDLSQMEGLLQLVQVEQNIYNIVFHELIRQVSVTCAERGQLLAKLRQRYQRLLERIPLHLKALHTETLAQRALDRRLTEEIHHIRAAMQRLSAELSRVREHDVFISQQAQRAHQQLAGALEESHTHSEVVQGYHQLYELQRTRLKAQLLHMTEEKDYWSQVTFRLALKVISLKKLQLFSRLQLSAQSWFSTAEHCSRYLASKDTEQLNVLAELTDQWSETLAALVSRLQSAENVQRQQLAAIRDDVGRRLQNQCCDPKYETDSLQRILTDVKQWSQTLSLQLESYQGEELLCGQQTLADLRHVQERRMNLSLQLFRRHPSPDEAPPTGQEDVRELDTVQSVLLHQLETQVSGESGIHQQMALLLRSMEAWGSKLERLETTAASDWLDLEKALRDWQRSAERVFQDVTKAENGNDPYTETKKVLDKVKEFITNLSKFTDGENQRLSEEVSSLHTAQTRWMLGLLLLVVPDQDQDQNQNQDQDLEQQNQDTMNASLQTLDDDAKTLAVKLDRFSRYVTSSCKLIVEEQILQNPRDVDEEHEMDECRKLQAECVDWAETCVILLSGLSGGPVREADPSSSRDVSPADSEETLVNDQLPAASEFKQETEAERRGDAAEGRDAQEVCQGALAVRQSPVLKLIGFDGNITQRTLGESSVHLNGELVASPLTDEAQAAFSDLTTVGLLQQELQGSELRVQSAEQRALKAEEALQAALDQIQDLERRLQGPTGPTPGCSEAEHRSPAPPETSAAPQKKSSADTKPRSSTKRTKKR